VLRRRDPTPQFAPAPLARWGRCVLAMNTLRSAWRREIREPIPDLITKAMKLPVVFIILAVLASPASAYKIVCNPAVTANCPVRQQQAPRPRPLPPG
jgi:hypothetical protein